jgi:hypothetical protein
MSIALSGLSVSRIFGAIGFLLLGWLIGRENNLPNAIGPGPVSRLFTRCADIEISVPPGVRHMQGLRSVIANCRIGGKIAVGSQLFW